MDQTLLFQCSEDHQKLLERTCLIRQNIIQIDRVQTEAGQDFLFRARQIPGTSASSSSRHLHAQILQDLLRLQNTHGALSDQIVRPLAQWISETSRDRVYIPSLIQCGIRRDQGPGSFSCLQHKNSLGKPADDPVPQGEPGTDGRNPRRIFGKDQLGLAHFLIQAEVPLGIADIDAANH